MNTKRNFTHIINPVKVPPTSDLFVAQPITFESMYRAKQNAKTHLDVRLLSVQYEEDLSIVPSYFGIGRNLKRSVIDLGQFSKPKKLPFIRDILDEAMVFNPDADYVIYSNVDIGLMPEFYNRISKLIERGIDAIAINRKTVSSEYNSIAQLNTIYNDKGKPHEGIDTFVFPASWISKFVLEDAIIGSGPVGLVFAVNMINLTKRFVWLQNPNLTFHIGDDKAWINPGGLDLIDFSYEQLEKISMKLYSPFRFGVRNSLYRETFKLCREIVSNHSIEKKFESSYTPKRTLSKLSMPLN